jgi:hypothetical protein
MLRIRPLKTLFSLSALLFAGLLLTGCGNGVGVAPATAAAAGAPQAPTPPPVAAPVALTGTPATSVTAGQNYQFQPAVSAGAGAVTFQIQGKPTWASFNTSTGALTGTPAVANEGTSAGITITGSNGSTSASIGPFAIAVKAPATSPPSSPATGSANLSWTIPTENTDGSPVTDLAGYHIYYGTSAGAWTSTITVLDASETSYVVSGLAAGTYYFAIVAFNTAGADSPQSNMGSKTI